MTAIIIACIVLMPIAIGYLFAMREDASNHKHFMRVTELNP